MNLKIVEVDDSANWAKLMVGAFDDEDRARPSIVEHGRPLLEAVAARRKVSTGALERMRLVIDLQTEEGAFFEVAPERDPAADLDRHQIWVCPLFLPFLTWFYKRGGSMNLPAVVMLEPSDTPKLQGYRRPGPEFTGLAQIRTRIVAALSASGASDLPQSLAQLYGFAERVLTGPEYFLFKTFVTSHQTQEANRWLGAILMDSGRFISAPVGPGQIGMLPR